MLRPPPRAISIPGHLVIRSKDASPSVDFRKSSPGVAIIFCTLLVFALLLLLLYLFYRRNSASIASSIFWLRQCKSAETRTGTSTNGSLQDPCEQALNESKQSLARPALQEPAKQSFGQSMQQAVLGVFKSKHKPDDAVVDVEKGQISAPPELGSLGIHTTGVSADDWTRRSPSTDVSIPTKLSMAMQPAMGRPQSRKATARPGISAFSWSTVVPTPLPSSHPTMKENPLPPLPFYKDLRRDTTLTTMTEDSEPIRHRSLTSWVENMQMRREKRERHRQDRSQDMGSTVRPDSLALPPVAALSGRDAGGYDEEPFRLSTMTIDTNSKTPALQTARMAWHVRQGPEQVEVPRMPRSTSRRQNPGPGKQDASRSQNLGLGKQDASRDFRGDEKEDLLQQLQESKPLTKECSRQEKCRQEGESSQEKGYVRQEELIQGYGQRDDAQGDDAQKEYGQRENMQGGEYAQQGGYSPPGHSPQEGQPQESQQATEHPDYGGEGYGHQDYENPEQQYDHDQDKQELPASEIQIEPSPPTTTLPEEGCIPNVTRYPSGATDTTSASVPPLQRVREI